MLQSLHGAAQKWVGLLLFTVLIGSFVIWGIADVYNARTPHQNVIKVGKVDITAAQLQMEVKSKIATLTQLTGRALSMKEAVDFGLTERVTQNLIDRAVMEQEAKRLGLRIGDNIILDSVRQIPQLKKPDGTFDTAAFRAALANAGMTEKGFIESQRINLSRETLTKAITANVTVPTLLAQALTAAQNEARTIETYQVKFADQPLPAKPSDDTLTTYISDHKEQFTRPEYRKLSFVRLSAESIGQDVAVNDDEVKQAYETRQSEFNTPEKRTIKQVVFDTEDKAQAFAAAAKGKDFAAAAKATDTTVADLGTLTKDDLPPELQEAAFALSAKQISAPVQSALGWHVLQVTAVTPQQTQDLAKVKDKIIADIRLQKGGDMLIKESQQLDDQLASGANLEEIAKDLGLVLQQVTAVDANGKDEKGNSIGPILGRPEMLTEAFKLSEGSQSNLITAGEDYYVVKVESTTPAVLKKLSEARTEALAAYNRTEQMKTATLQADKLIEALKTGQTFEGAAKQFKVESSLEKNLTRSATVPSYMPEEFRTVLFGLKANEVTQTETKDAILVARLQKIDHPVALEKVKTDAGLQNQLEDAMAADLLQAYTTQLKKRYPVKIDQDKINALFVAESDSEE